MSEQRRSIFAQNYKAGPHGLGDPDDKRLRKIEKDVLIPQKMRDRAKEEKCVKEVQEFAKCCKDSNFLMVFRCKELNNALISCLELWYKDPQFKNECTQAYLEERSEYRRTGIPKSSKRKRAVSSS
ncbi:COX assembly mitochondrial protein homolog [Osmia lignaria lignaria]|uniref:COX assembly mitochondrial protein homolog n=1 Tax=Osmia lignaria TaxID=473952 RepID=UPI00147917AC|nr:COX assembly mitochondrial protein homolog [Osmia lignaria]XP_034182547.1 COX assembly mitochondrial protein homolog [Osmia lignaria]XP_034182549.1 COX assembly mitochondrial protein homolog [Osmia lignaria]